MANGYEDIQNFGPKCFLDLSGLWKHQWKVNFLPVFFGRKQVRSCEKLHSKSPEPDPCKEASLEPVSIHQDHVLPFKNHAGTSMFLLNDKRYYCSRIL